MPPLAPDRFERVLGVAALLMLAAVVAAVGRGRTEWARIPVEVWPHLATVVVALALTPVMMFARRGDRRHRLLGRVWVVTMVLTALLSFRVRLIDGGGFSWIHLLSAWVLVQAPLVWWTARTHDVARHRSMVRGLATGSLLVAGFFTFPFDRLLGHWLFG